MPIAKLVYRMPEESEEFDTARHGMDYRIALSNIDGRLRAMAKYQEKITLTIDEVRVMIREELGNLEL